MTTFLTQIAGQRVMFEPHARVWAEEPMTIGGLWKQRVRLARGNIQITRRFRHLWFRPQAGHRLGSISPAPGGPSGSVTIILVRTLFC